MGQLIPWLVVFALIGFALWALIRENNAKRRRSVDEFERDVARAKKSLLRGGLLALDMFFNERQKRAAIEYRMDEEAGRTKTGGKDDDRDRTSVQE